MTVADRRVHGTTHERPIDRFSAEGQAALRPLPALPLTVRHRRLRRARATIRSSIFLVGDDAVEVVENAERVAIHRRSSEPHSRIVDPAPLTGGHTVLFVSATTLLAALANDSSRDATSA